eukprot:1826765-Ditylum_brightwellii.AAC.1
MSGIPCNNDMDHMGSNEVSSTLQTQQCTGLDLLSRISLGERDMPVPPTKNSNAHIPNFDIPIVTTDVPTAASHAPQPNNYIPLSDNALISITNAALQHE